MHLHENTSHLGLLVHRGGTRTPAQPRGFQSGGGPPLPLTVSRPCGGINVLGLVVQ
jgi:hypothetical protein